MTKWIAKSSRSVLNTVLGNQHRRILSRKATNALAIAAVFAMQSGPAAQAGTYYWDADGNLITSFPDSPATGLAGGGTSTAGTGLGGTGTWDTSSSLWFRNASGASSVLAPADIAWPNLTTDIADFVGTAGVVTVQAGGINAGALQFFTTGYTVGGATAGTGGTITLGAGTGGTTNAAGNIFLGTGTDTINTVIAGSNGLNLVGPGTLVLTQANTVSGGITLNSGAGLTLDSTVAGAVASNILSAGQALTLNNGTLTIKGSAGALGSNSFSGVTVAGAGVITLTVGTAGLATDLGAISHTIGGTLQFTNTPNTGVNIVTTSTVNTNGILGNWAFTSNGAGNQKYVTVNGSNQIVAFTGTTAATAAALTDTTGTVNYELTAGGTAAASFSGNTIRYSNATTAATITGTTSFTINGLLNANAGVLTLNGTGITIGAANELVVNANGGVVFSTAIGGATGAGLTVGGGGGSTVTLNAVNTYTGKTTVNTGSLVLGIANAVNSASTLVVNGGTFSMGAFNESLAGVSLTSGTISGTGTLTNASAYDVQSGTINAVLAGSAGLVKTTAGTVLLSPASGVAESFTGGVTIKAGVLIAGTGNTLAVLGTNAITLGDTSGSADARFVYAGSNGTYSNAIMLATGTTGLLSIGTTNSTTAVTFTGGIAGNNSITINGAGTTGTLTFSTAAVNNAGAFTNGGTYLGTGTGATILTVPLGTSVTEVNQISTAPLTFTIAAGAAAITTAIPVNVVAGTLNYGISGTAATASNILGTGTITLTPGTSNLSISTGSSSFNDTLSNPLVIAQAPGTATITDSGGVIFSGTVTFGTGGTGTPTLKLTNTNGSQAPLNLTNTISGTGNIQFNPTGTNANETLSGAQNQVGTITNVGTATTTTSVATLSGVIGSGITGISQAGTNPFTVTSAITLNANLNGFASTGTGLFTLGPISGAQNLTLSANSTGAITVSGAITITGTGTNNGVITNNGSGYGTVTINGSTLGTGVASIVQSSTTSPLVITGTVPNSVTITDTSGETLFSTPAALQATHITVGGVLGLAYGSSGQFQQSDVQTVLTAPNASYPNLSFATSGASIGLDTSTASASYTAAIANPSGVTGTFGFVKLGTNTLTVGNANTYNGQTQIWNGTLSAASLDYITSGSYTNHGLGSSLGAPTTVANGTIALGFGTTTGTLSYTGAGETTDRVINLVGTTGGGGLDQSGSGPLHFTSPITFTGAGTKTLTLSGSTSSDGYLDASLGGTFSNTATAPTAPFTVNKTGTGTWHLTGATNTASTLAISSGTFDTGPNGLTLGDAGGATINGNGTSGNSATITGKINLAGIGGSYNGADVGSTVAGFTLNINAVIAGGTTNNIDFYSNGTTVLGAANTYQGQSQFNGTTVVVTTINNAAGTTFASGSSLGIPSGTSAKGNANSVLVFAGGALKYVGTGETTDRVLDLNGNAIIDQSGTGLLKFTGANTATSGAAHTFTLQGSTAGTGEIAGTIVDNTSTFTTGIIKTGTGAWTLSGVNTYTGATTVNGGNLILSQGTAGTGVLNNTAITINSGGTLSPLGGTSGYFAGNTATTLAGAKLTLNSGGTLNLADGVVNPFVLIQGATFAGNAAAFAGGSLQFDLSSTAADYIDVRLGNATGTGLATSSGSNAVVINPISGSLTAGTYTLIKAAGTLSNANFFLASPTITVGSNTYNLTLSLQGTNEVLTVANGASSTAPGLAYWTGSIDSSWATQTGGAGGPTNFATSPGSTANTFALPSATTNVFFTANTATNFNPSTLDRAFTINSLNFTGSGTANTAGSTISSGTGNNSLTINATNANNNTAGSGITIAANSGANLISANVILGSSQTWTNSATTTTTVSGIVSELTAGLSLTKAGSGTIALNGLNTFTGAVTVSAGTLSIATVGSSTADGGLGHSAGAVNLGATTVGGTLLLTGAGETTDHVINLAGTTGGAVLDQSGTGNLKFTSAFTATGVGAKTLTLQGSTLGTGEIAGAIVDSSSGATTLTKLGTGTWTLSGTPTYTGNTNVNGGTLVYASTATFTAPSTARLFLGVGGTSGAVIQKAGSTVVVASATGGTDVTGLGESGGYGYYNNSGSLTTGQLAIGGATAGTNNTGVFEQNGGSTTVSAASGYLIFGWTGANANGVLNIFNGTVTNNSTGQDVQMGFGTTLNSFGLLNVLGPGASLDATAGGATRGINLSVTAGNFAGVLNLNGGTVLTNFIKSGNTGTPTYLGFNGGTLQAKSATTTFLGGLTSATIYSGGGTINTNGVNVTVSQALLAPTGSGLTGITLASGGAGYIGAPAVRITGGGGTGATAIAIVDLDPASGTYGQITGFTVTSAGSGYTSAPTVTLIGGGASTVATIATGAIGATAATGGFTKTGLGTLTLSGASTYGGPTIISGGVLTATTLANGGATSAIGSSGNAATNLVLNGGVLQYTGTVAATTDRNFTLTSNGGGLDASGTTAGAVIFNGSMTATGTTGSQTFTLSGSGTGTSGAGTLNSTITDGTGGNFTNVIKAGTGSWTLGNAANSYTGSTTITGGILTVNTLANGLSNSGIGASSNAASNLVLSGGTLLYTGGTVSSDRNFTLGNAITAAGGGIDSEGTGPLTITGDVTAANTAAGTQVLTLTANAGSGNNTLSGMIPNGSATALTAVTKVGAGSWSLTGANTFGGSTTISAGRLAVGDGTGNGSLGDTAISVASGATFAALPGSGTLTAGTGTGSLGATLAVSAGGTYTMVDGAIGTFNLSQGASFATSPLTLTSSTLNLELASIGADQLIASGGTGTAAITGNNVVNITALGSSLAGGTYAIVKANGIAAGNTSFKFSNGTAQESLTVGGSTYILTLVGIAGQEQITVTAPTSALTWTGQTNGNGANDSNWSTTAGHLNFATGTTPQDYSDGAVVTFQDTNTVTGANVVNGAVTIQAAGVKPADVQVNNSAVNYVVSNASGAVGIAGSTGLTKTGTATLTLSSVNTYTGPTAINGGTVNAGVGGALGTGTISFAGGTLQYGTGNTTDYSARFATTPNQALSIDTNGQNVSYATVLGSTGGTLVKSGAGVLTLNAVETYSGNTIVNGGTLTVAKLNGNLGGIGSPTITVNVGGTLNLTGGTDNLGYVAGRNALVINDGTVTNNTTGSRVTLSNVVTMVGGTLGGTSTGDGSSGAYSMNTPGVLATSDAAGNPALISANISTQGVINFNVTRGTGPVAAGAPDLIITGPITPYGSGGTNGITKAGNGILTLSGASTYKGTTTIAAGIVNIGVSNVGTTSGAAGVSTAGVVLGNTTGSASASLLTQGAFTFANPISVAAGNTGLQTLGGATDNNSTFSGQITLNNALTISQVATATNNALNLTGGITGSATASRPQTVTFAGPGRVNVGTTGLSDGTGAGSAVSLVTAGGILTLTAPSTNTGTTTVGGLGNAATLFAANSTGSATGSGAVNVNAAGLLLGTGTIADTGGPVAINAGGTISAGGSSTDRTLTGQLTLTSGSFNSGGTYNWKINNGTTGVKGMDWDLLNFTGTGTALAVNSNSASPFTIKVFGSAASLPAFDPSPAATQSQTVYEIAQVGSLASLSGFDLSKFAIDQSNFTGGGTFVLQMDTSATPGVDLVYTPTPEPVVTGILGLAAMGLIRRPGRRRKQRGQAAA